MVYQFGEVQTVTTVADEGSSSWWVNFVVGLGTVVRDALPCSLGRRRPSSCCPPEDKVKPVMSSLNQVIYEGEDKHRICFAVPVERISLSQLSDPDSLGGSRHSGA